MTCLFCLCCDCTGGITTLNGCLISSFTTRLPANYNNPMQTVLDPKPSQNPQRPKTLHKPELKTALNTSKLECWTIPIRLPSLHPPLFHNHEKRSSFLLLQMTMFKIKNQLAIPNINNATGVDDHGGYRSHPQNHSLEKEHGLLCVYHCGHFAHFRHTHECSSSCNSKSPLFTDRTRGPQLDTKEAPQSTPPDERKDCLRSNLCEQQTAMLERPLSAEQHQSLHREQQESWLTKNANHRRNLWT